MFFGTSGGPEGKGRRLYFSTGAGIVVAETSASELHEPIRILFPEYEVPEPDSRVTEPVAVGLSGRRGTYLVTAPDAPAVRCTTRMNAIVAFEFALSRALASSLQDFVHMHASGSVVRGRAVLAVGDSGAGKSSIAAAMLTRGYRTLGDDAVLLDASGRAAPFKRLLKVSREVLEELGIDPATTVHWDPEWPEAWIDPLEGPGWAEPADIGIVALARYSGHGSLRVSPVSRPDGLNSLVRNVMSCGMGAADAFDRLVKIAGDAEFVEVEFSSASHAADALRALAE